MKNRAGHFISECANLIMVSVIYLTVVVFSEIWITKEFKLLSLPILCALILFSYFSRVKVANFIVYALSHIIIGVGLFFLPKSLGRTELILAFAVIFVMDMAYWIKKKSGGFAYPAIGFVLLNALAYLYADIKKNGPAMLFFFVLGMLYFVLYYVRLFFKNAVKLAKEGEEDEKMPYGEMLKNGGRFAIPFVIITVLIMALAKVDAFDRYTIAFLELLGKLAGKVIKLIVIVLSWIESLFAGSTEEDYSAVRELLEGIDQTGPVYRIITAVFATAIIFLLFFMLAKGIIAIIKKIQLHRTFKETVIEKEDMVEIRCRIPKEERAKCEKLRGVRKIYKRTVEKAVKKGYPLKRNQTPRERATDFLEKRKEDITDLSFRYETVRYKV